MQCALLLCSLCVFHQYLSGSRVAACFMLRAEEGPPPRRLASPAEMAHQKSLLCKVVFFSPCFVLICLTFGNDLGDGPDGGRDTRARRTVDLKRCSNYRLHYEFVICCLGARQPAFHAVAAVAACFYSCGLILFGDGGQ